MTEWQLALTNIVSIKAQPEPGHKECAASDCSKHFPIRATHPSQIYCSPVCSNRTRKKRGKKLI